MVNNKLLEKLKQKHKVLGVWNTLSSPRVTDVLASAGLDFIFLDFEHGPIDLNQITNYISTCHQYNVTPIVRIPTQASWLTLQVLDQGAHGVICPQVRNIEDVAAFTSSCYYYPRGQRGLTPFTKAGAYGFSEKHLESSNENIISMVIIETAEAIQNFDEIIKDKNLNLVFFGTYDLSQVMGKPGQTQDPELIALIKTLIAKAKSAGKYTGGFLAKTPEDLLWQRELDMDLYVYGVDSFLLAQTVRKAVTAFAEVRT